jgi:hypothetical protein
MSIVQSLLVVGSALGGISAAWFIYDKWRDRHRPFDPRELQFVPSATTAVVTGKVLTRGHKTSVWFEWGPSPALGKVSERQTHTKDAEVYQHLSGLKKNTRYYYRMIAENEFGRLEGAVAVLLTSSGH